MLKFMRYTINGLRIVMRSTFHQKVVPCLTVTIFIKECSVAEPVALIDSVQDCLTIRHFLVSHPAILWQQRELLSYQ